MKSKFDKSTNYYLMLAAVGSGAAVSHTVLLAAVGRIAAKYAGVVGVALMIANFTECMGWW